MFLICCKEISILQFSSDLFEANKKIITIEVGLPFCLFVLICVDFFCSLLLLRFFFGDQIFVAFLVTFLAPLFFFSFFLYYFLLNVALLYTCVAFFVSFFLSPCVCNFFVIFLSFLFTSLFLLLPPFFELNRQFTKYMKIKKCD